MSGRAPVGFCVCVFVAKIKDFTKDMHHWNRKMVRLVKSIAPNSVLFSRFYCMYCCLFLAQLLGLSMCGFKFCSRNSLSLSSLSGMLQTILSLTSESFKFPNSRILLSVCNSTKYWSKHTPCFWSHEKNISLKCNVLSWHKVLFKLVHKPQACIIINSETVVYIQRIFTNHVQQKLCFYLIVLFWSTSTCSHMLNLCLNLFQLSATFPVSGIGVGGRSLSMFPLLYLDEQTPVCLSLH